MQICHYTLLAPIDQDIDDFLRLLEQLTQQNNFDESCAFRYDKRWSVYCISEDEIPALTSLDGNGQFRLRRQSTDRDAVRDFFQQMLGAGTPWIAEGRILEQIKEDFRQCLNANLPGPILHALYDRAAEFVDDLRISTEITSGAVSPEALSRELAGKILEDESEAVLSIIGDGESFANFVHYWSGSRVQKLYCIHRDFLEAETLCLANEAIPVRWEIRREILSQSDVIISASEEFDLMISRELVQQNLQKRRRRHLLLFNWSEQEVVDESVSKLPAVFTYSRDDLERALIQARSRREKILEQLQPQFSEAVDQFYQWVYSEERFQFHGIVGKSHKMQSVFELIRRVAETDITVLVQGETGTGKELVARAIHKYSPRSTEPFVAVNCGAIPETLLESELFGHTKGAFTGASEDRQGMLREAEGGTVFLDEIGDTTEMFQVKLLRALQEREIQPLGSSQPVPINVRIIAATGKNLQREVDAGKFRSDLYYRINVVRIELPPLRDRREDILPLVRHFIKKFNQRMGKKVRDVSPEAAQALENYDWNGNVRELENAIERAVALTLGYEITASDLPENIVKKSYEKASTSSTQQIKTLEEVEADYIGKLLREYEGNYSEVAEILGIGRTTLWRKMKKYGFE